MKKNDQELALKTITALANVARQMVARSYNIRVDKVGAKELEHYMEVEIFKRLPKDQKINHHKSKHMAAEIAERFKKEIGK